jgi:hypothetical protein
MAVTANKSPLMEPPMEPIVMEAARIEQELKELTVQLERRASEKTADFFTAEQQEQVQQNLDTKAVQDTAVPRQTVRLPPEKMADFTALLNVIQGYTTLIRRDLGDVTQLKENIASIREAAFLIEALIDSRICTTRPPVSNHR